MIVLVSPQRIAAIVENLAVRMRSDRPILLMPILTGAMVFCADLLRRMPHNTQVEPILLERVGTVRRIVHAPILTGKYRDCEPWIVDDVIASGTALAMALAKFPGAQVYSVVLWGLECLKTRLVQPTLIGEEVPASWVCGYGTDALGCFRGAMALSGRDES